jgi:hypothetical protein
MAAGSRCLPRSAAGGASARGVTRLRRGGPPPWGASVRRPSAGAWGCRATTVQCARARGARRGRGGRRGPDPGDARPRGCRLCRAAPAAPGTRARQGPPCPEGGAGGSHNAEGAGHGPIRSAAAAPRTFDARPASGKGGRWAPPRPRRPRGRPRRAHPPVPRLAREGLTAPGRAGRRALLAVSPMGETGRQGEGRAGAARGGRRAAPGRGGATRGRKEERGEAGGGAGRRDQEPCSRGSRSARGPRAAPLGAAHHAAAAAVTASRLRLFLAFVGSRSGLSRTLRGGGGEKVHGGCGRET